MTVLGDLSGEEWEKLIDLMEKRLRELLGPLPPCTLCGKESRHLITAPPIKPEDIEDSKRFFFKVAQRRIFQPFYVCGDHTTEEIDREFRRRGGRRFEEAAEQ